MKTRTYTWLTIFLLVAAVIFISASCDNGGSSGTLTVVLSGIPAGSDGHLLLIGVYADGADPWTAPMLGMSDLDIGTETSKVVEDPTTRDIATFDPGDYDLYMWIDMNDNLETVQEPEQDIDLVYKDFPVPVDVTINGDITVTVLSSDFELSPGFD